MERPEVLIQDLHEFVQDVHGSFSTPVCGITSDSRKVEPGFLFVAKRGGERFLSEVIAKGASSILTERYHPEYPFLAQLITSDLLFSEERVAKRFYQDSYPPLFTVGITGTNGKTTTSYILRHLLLPCGLIGTIEWDVGSEVFPSTHTTPDLLDNYRLFSLMRKNGCKSCVMEVSSHGLDQRRVRGIEFDAAIFTNLTQDHLDYHKTLERYAEAKAKLFTALLPNKTAIMNLDSPYALSMIQNTQAQILTYGLCDKADIRASSIVSHAEGLVFSLEYKGQKVPCKTSLVGSYNLYNILAATSAALVKGLSLSEIATKLEQGVTVPGRLEPIANEKGIFVFVDYAHTEDALFNVLSTLKRTAQRRILTVFGCGGNRDRDKRSKMGKVAEELSDLVVVTSDNPRSEDPDKIIEEIVKGIKGTPVVLQDRREAIGFAISQAREGDIVLIAGKGHEQGQIIGVETHPFDDRQVARDFVRKRKVLGGF